MVVYQSCFVCQKVSGNFQYFLSSFCLGVEETRKLARNHCNEAMDSVAAIKDSTYKQTLAHLCETVLNRIN
jgi:hypothetical protein